MRIFYHILGSRLHHGGTEELSHLEMIGSIVSQLTTEGIVNKILLGHGIEIGADGLHDRPPLEGDRICAPLQDDYRAWSDEHLKAGSFLPLD